MKKSDEPVIVEQELNAKIEEVWKAITEVNEMRKWFFENIPEFKAEVGFETQFNVANEGRNFLHQWRIRKVIPHEMIEYNWSYKEYSGNAFVRFELKEDNHKVRVTLTNIVTEDFPQDIPEFKRESCIGGWNYFIKERLYDYLENKK